MPSLLDLAAAWAKGGRELAILLYDAASDSELSRAVNAARKMAGRSATSMTLGRGPDGDIMYDDGCGGGARPLFGDKEKKMRLILHNIDTRAAASKLASPTLSVMGLNSDVDDGDDVSLASDGSWTSAVQEAPLYATTMSLGDVASASAPNAVDIVQLFLEEHMAMISASSSASTAAPDAHPPVTASALSTVNLLQKMASERDAMAVVSMTTAVTTKDSRSVQHATLSRAYAAFGSHLKQHCKTKDEMDALCSVLNRSKRRVQPYAHAFEAFQRLPTLRKVVTAPLRYKHEGYVFTSQYVSRDLKGVLQDMLELWGANPHRGPLFASGTGCTTGFQFTDSAFADRLRRRAQKRLGFNPDTETLVIVEVANDETADSGTSQDIARVRLRNMSALDHSVPYAMWMLLPVRGTVKCADKEGRAVAKSASVNWTDALNALHREALCKGLKQFAEIAKAPVPCMVGGKVVMARFVLGPVVGDMPVRAGFLGSMQRWSTKPQNVTSASFIGHYAHVYPKSVEDEAGADGTQSKDALLSDLLDALETRTQKRDAELLVDAKAARGRGINPKLYNEAPLSDRSVRLLDRHLHVMADPLHAFDGFVDVLDRVAAEAIGASEWRSALALVQHPFADGAKRGLAGNVSDRIRETWKLVPAAFHCALKNLSDVRLLQPVRLLANACLLLGCYTDIAPSVLTTPISTFCKGVGLALNALQRLDIINARTVMTPKLVETLVTMKAMATKGRMRPANTSTVLFEKANKEAKSANRLHASGRLDSQASVLQRAAASEIVDAFDKMPQTQGTSEPEPPASARDDDGEPDEGDEPEVDAHGQPVGGYGGAKLKAFYRLVGRPRELPDARAGATAAWDAACVVLPEIFGRSVLLDAAESVVQELETEIDWLLDKVPLRVADGLLLQAVLGQERTCVYKDEVRVPRTHAQGTHHAVAYADAAKVAAAAESVPDGGDCQDPTCPFHQNIEFMASMVHQDSTSFGIPVLFLQSSAPAQSQLIVMVVARLAPHRPDDWALHFNPAAGDVMQWWPSSLEVAAAEGAGEEDGTSDPHEDALRAHVHASATMERTATAGAVTAQVSDSSSDSTWSPIETKGNRKAAKPLPPATPELVVVSVSQVRGSRPMMRIPGLGVWVSYVSARQLVAGMGV